MSKDINKICKQIKSTIDYHTEANKNFVRFCEFVYKKSLYTEDVSELKSHNKPTLDFNIIRPYIWRSLKNVLDSDISMTFTADDKNEMHPQQMGLNYGQMADFINTKYDEIQDNNHYEDVIYHVSSDAYVGGKGIIKIKTDYENTYNFKQCFKFEAVKNPTMIHFDPRAKCITKKDSDFCFEIIPFKKEEFEARYPDVDIEKLERNNKLYGNVVYDTNQQEKIINVCEYYYIHRRYKTIYQLENGEIVDKMPVTGTRILKRRKIESRIVKMIRLSGDTILEAERDTNFEDLPYVMVGGEYYYDGNGQEHLLPYAKHAFDGQRFKNITANIFLDAALNNHVTKFIVSEECTTKNTLEAIRNPVKFNYIPVRALSELGNVALPPPTVITSPPLPTQLIETFQMMSQSVEESLGVKEPSFDVKQMSGKALYNLSQYTSSSNEKFMQNLELAVTQCAKVILNAMPKVLETEMFTFKNKQNEEMQQQFDFMFETSKIHIKAERGVSHKLQQEATLEMLMDLGKESPVFAQFLNTPSMIEFMLENIDMNDKSKLLKEWEKFTQQQQQAAQQPNPQMQIEQEKLQNDKMGAQAKLMEAQARQEEIKLRAHEAGMKHQNNHLDKQLDVARLVSEDRRNQLDNATKMSQSNTKYKESLLNHARDQHEKYERK